MKTAAHKMIERSKSIVDLMRMCKESADKTDQDWDGELTYFTFKDGSVVAISGNCAEVWTKKTLQE